MYAIIKAGGNQYKVEIGKMIEVDLLPNAENTEIQYPALMVADGDKVELGKEAGKILVTAKIVKHFKGEKIDVMRFRHKVRHRRHIGFRAHMSQLLILSIGKSKEVKSVVPKTTVKPKIKKVTKSKKI